MKQWWEKSDPNQGWCCLWLILIADVLAFLTRWLNCVTPLTPFGVLIYLTSTGLWHHVSQQNWVSGESRLPRCCLGQWWETSWREQPAPPGCDHSSLFYIKKGLYWVRSCQRILSFFSFTVFLLLPPALFLYLRFLNRSEVRFCQPGVEKQ